jgi:NAD(P)-dependent dehydrogenase (short-subunit alcohol dehydrogenase family)
MGKLTNQVAVVTGASKGIGADISKALAAEGASVVVNYASSKDGADRVVKESRPMAARLLPYKLTSRNRPTLRGFSPKPGRLSASLTFW